MKKISTINILKNTIIFFCITYLIYEIINNFNYIESIFIKNKNIFFILIFVQLVHLNIISLRNFSIFQICANYTGKFFDWCKIFYESLIFNILISHTGSVYRAIETKKRGLEYNKYVGLFYILFTSYILINIFLVLLELIFLPIIEFQFKLNLFIIFIILTILVIYLPKILKLLLFGNFIKKKFFKYKIIKKIIDNGELIFLFLSTKIFIKKTIFYLLIYGIMIHILDLFIFYFSSVIIQPEIPIKTLLLLFGLNFILDRIPLISNIPGINEILFASISIPLGFFFIDGLVLKLLLRVISVIGIFINYIIFYILNLINVIKI